MARSFNTGRQGEQLYNDELYKLFEAIKHIVDVPIDPSKGPEASLEGSLWLDRQNGGDLKYYEEGIWKLIFNNRFRMTSEILNPAQPEQPITGQLWLQDGILMYYNGVEWLPIKAVNVETSFDLSAFEQFLIINPLTISGDQIIDYGTGTPVMKSQFLLPSVDLDKFFINGAYTDDYERITNVAIQYPTEALQGKVASAIHVNPSKLIGITKRLVYIDKNNPVIPIPEMNTEYYAFKDGAGHLLLKSNEANSEYFSVSTGIKLKPDVANLYDFVLAMTYKFGNVKQQGHLEKKKIKLSGTNSIFIGDVSDPMCVFVQGFYLEEDSANYTYDSSTGYLNLTLPTKMDVSVISFPKKESGTISVIENGDGKITLTKTYNRPLVFVAGENVDLSLADFTYDSITNTMLIKNAISGMSYSIVEVDGDTPDSKMFSKAGTVPIPPANGQVSIPCTIDELPEDTLPILFVDGIMVAQRDIVRNSDNSISTYGLSAGQTYVLLKDPSNRLIFDDMVSFTTIPTSLMDTALVYIENQLICDSSSVYVSRLPKTAVNGEVKLLFEGGLEKWHKYDGATSSWKPIESNTQTDIDFLTALNQTAMGYSTSRKSISILQNFGTKDCSYYAYTFANSVEQPLLRDNILTNDTDTIYKVGFKHLYPIGSNALSIWLNGIRQYPSIAPGDGYVNEISTSQFELPEAIEGNLFYVIEKPERDEQKSCQRQVLTINDRVNGMANTYTTTVPLYPGNLRVFISGYRQPSTAYRIIDPYTIMFKDELIGGLDNYPTETTENASGQLVDVTHTVADKILIEVRQDYNLREVTLPIRYPNQREWNIYDDNLPRQILDTKDFIMIYINGSAYGKEYVLDKDKEAIILTNDDVTKTLGIDPIDQYFKENPAKYLEWQKENNYKKYDPKIIKDTITFEWR